MLNTILYYSLLFAVVGAPFYFQYRMQNTTQNKDTLPSMNSLTAKLSAFILVALYMMSFLSFQIKQNAYSKIGFCSCLLSFFLLYSFRGKMIHQIRAIPANPKERFQRSFRSLVAMTLLYGIYFLTVRILIPQVGIFPAVVVAVVFMVYATPLFVRVWMPSQRMHPSPIKEEILSVFTSAKSPIHEVFLLDTDRFKSYNALVCGPKFGFGPFKRSLFITKNLFEILEPAEIRAVIAHEAAHFKLHHIFKRSCMSIVAMLVSLFAVLLPIAFVSVLIVGTTLEQSYGLTVFATLGTVLVQTLFLFRVIRKQEFEADLEALHLGATPTTLTAALEKITEQNGMTRKKEDWISRFMFGHAHPSTEERIAAIQIGELPSSAKITPPWKFSLTYASFVIALGTLTAFEINSQQDTRQRLPASQNRVEANEITTDQ